MNSTTSFNALPLPIFKINTDFDILDSSPEATMLFTKKDNFTELVDPGSRMKAAAFIRPDSMAQKLELNFTDQAGNLFLADVHIKWESDHIANLVLVQKDPHMERIAAQLNKLQGRLRETDFELLSEKERTDALLHEVWDLSAPCIQLDKHKVLIPLFGKLEPEKMNIIQSKILDYLYVKAVETALLDFSAVGEIDKEGLFQLNTLLKTLEVMGIEVIIIGLHPLHAKRLHGLLGELNTRFASSLQDILSPFFSGKADLR
ncbi:MAG TPA: STAS domain-containing protein [Planococcus sp. (in: firmicutes)]|nr:STAS domain-containing protein [Planococcus sp. (in: firmicutes)]